MHSSNQQQCCYTKLLLFVMLSLQQISINLSNDLYYNNNNNNINVNNYDNFETTPMDSSSSSNNNNIMSSTVATVPAAILSSSNINKLGTGTGTDEFFVDGLENSQQQQQQQQQQYHQNQQQTFQPQQQQHHQRATGGFSLLDKEVVERLIKQWAPVVWLAPEEKFLPLGVDDFLQNVHPMDKDTKFIPGLPFAEYSQKSYLVTNAEVDELLQNNDSFIYGRNPNEYPVPVYAVVTLCNQLPVETNAIVNDGQQQQQPQQPMYVAPQQQQQQPFVKPPINEQQQQRDEQLAQQQLLQMPALTQQLLPLQAKAMFTGPLTNTRGPYIPITLDPRERLNDTIVRRSSRLYPIFQRVRRDVVVTTNNFLPPPLESSSMNVMLQPQLLQEYDLAIGEQQQQQQTHQHQQQQQQSLSPQNSNAEQSAAATVAVSGGSAPAPAPPNSNEDSAQVNNFIANLADNVKFTGYAPVNGYEENSISYNNNEHPASLGGPLPTGNNGNAANQNNINNNDLNRQRKLPGFHVTYWMFYPYSQGKTMCTISLGPLGSIPFPAVYGFCLGKRKDIGSHIGDWEHMSLYFNGAAEPEAMYVSAHDAGAYYSYNRLTGSFEFKKQETRKGILQRPNFPKTVTTFNDHPVLFAAKGSHGLWTAPGKHRFVKVARLYDINGFGTPWNTWKAVNITYENLKSYGRSLVPNWLTFKGKWGNPKSKCHPFRRIGLNFCEYTDGPTGIPLKEPHFQCGLSYR